MPSNVDQGRRGYRASNRPAESPGRSRTAPCRRTYCPAGPDGRSVQAQEACRCAQAAAHYFRIFGTAGPSPDDPASQSAMGSPPVDVQPPPRKTHRPRIPEANVGGCLLPARCVHADIPRHVSDLTRYFLRPCWPPAPPENRFDPARPRSTSTSSPGRQGFARTAAVRPGSSQHRISTPARGVPERRC